MKRTLSVFGLLISMEGWVVSTTASVQQGLGFEEIDELRLAVAPIEEQREISRFCELQRKVHYQLKSPVEKSVDGLQEYRSALITAAVTGQIAELR